MASTQERAQGERTADLARSAGQQAFPWERQLSESPQAFARFLAYRDTAPAERSIRKLGVSMQLAARWSRKWRWVARVSAYDAWLLELSDATANHAVLRHRQALARFGSLSVDKASKTVAKLNEDKLTADEAIDLAVNGAKLSRMAFGLSEGETKAERAPQASVSLSFNSAWLAKPEQNEAKPVVLAGEQVIAEGDRPPARRPEVKRLAERIVKSPKSTK